MHIVMPPIVSGAVGFVAAFVFLVLLAALYAVPGVAIAHFGLGHYKPVKGKRRLDPRFQSRSAVLRHRHN